MKKIKVIITGATGMIGKAALIECLESDKVASVLVVNRKSVAVQHPKLKEIIHKDFFNLDSIKAELSGYDACFFCLGISSIGMNEATYYKITYELTEQFASTLYRLNPNMVFNYVSGQGTDSTEKGRVMWARVKGKTENMVFNKGFKDAYAVRIGGVWPVKGVRSKTGWVNAIYTIMKPFAPLFRRGSSLVDSSTVGLAMINSVFHPQENKILRNKELQVLGNLD